MNSITLLVLKLLEPEFSSKVWNSECKFTVHFYEVQLLFERKTYYSNRLHVSFLYFSVGEVDEKCC